MKKQLLILSIIAMGAFGCQGEKLAELRFCADVRLEDPCYGEDTVFIHGTNVWAHLLLSPKFQDTVVIGNFYGFQDGKRIFIESKVHDLDEGQDIIMEALFINLCGDYEVEFLDTKGNLLAKGGFEIW